MLKLKNLYVWLPSITITNLYIPRWIANLAMSSAPTIAKPSVNRAFSSITLLDRLTRRRIQLGGSEYTTSNSDLPLYSVREQHPPPHYFNDISSVYMAPTDPLLSRLVKWNLG
ncbi:hypothetical protein H1R20_g10487, partial [Candolleomyces eurysporus]